MHYLRILILSFFCFGSNLSIANGLLILSCVLSSLTMCNIGDREELMLPFIDSRHTW